MQDWLKAFHGANQPFPAMEIARMHTIYSSIPEQNASRKINTEGVRRSERDVEELCTFFEQKLRRRKLSTSVFRLLQRAHSQEWQRLWLPQFQDVARFGSGCF